MTSATASVVVIGAVVLLIAAAILQFTHRRRLGNWLLLAFPACFCLAAIADLAHGATYLGRSTYESDLKELGFAVTVLLITVAAAVLFRIRWLFAQHGC